MTVQPLRGGGEQYQGVPLERPLIENGRPTVLIFGVRLTSYVKELGAFW